MTVPFHRLDADFYQLSGEDAEQEHIAASGALSVAGLYANHGNETTHDNVVGDANHGLNTTAMAYRPHVSHAGSLATDVEYAGAPYTAVPASQAPQAAPLAIAPVLDPVATLLNFPLAGLTASALGQLGSSLGNAVGGNGNNGNNGQSGGNGTDGNDGNDGGHCATPPTPCDPPTPTHCGPGGGHHHGDTNITIVDIDTVVNHVTNVVTNVVNHLHGDDTLIDIDILNNETHTNTHLIDIDLGGVHHHGGDDNNIIDINLGGVHHTVGNDNDVIDLGLGGASHIGGDDNDLIDLGLSNSNHVAGNDNDVIDLGLGGASHIGGNDNDIIDLGLSNDSNVQGNDNDLIDLGLSNGNHVGGDDNDLIDLGLGDHGTTGGDDNDLIDLGLNNHGTTTGTDHDLIGLDLNLMDEGNDSHSGDVLGSDLDLLNDDALAGIDLSLGNLDLADVSLNGQSTSDHALLDLNQQGGDLLGQGCDGLLSDDLAIDMSFDNDLGTSLGQGDSSLLDGLGLNNDTSHLAANHGGGTVLGLQLGLGAWV